MMNNAEIGPLMTDKEFFSSLNTEISDIARCTSLFADGSTVEAKRKFLEYVKAELDRTRYFNAIDFDPTSEPDNLTKTQAEEAMSYNLVSCNIYHRFEGGVDWYSNHTYNKYEEWTWQLSRHRQVLDLSWMYSYTGDEKYAVRAVELLKSWIRQATVPPLETDGHTTLCWRTIECGIRMKVWAKCIIMLLDSQAVEPEFIVDFFKSVHEHAVRLSLRYTAANWLAIEMNGLYVASLLYPFFKESGKWRELAKSIFTNEMNTQTLADGSHYELSFGYQHVALICFGEVARLGLTFNDQFPDEYTEKLRSHIHTLIKMTMPTGGNPPVNDGRLDDVATALKKFSVLFPDDGLICWAMDHTQGHEPDFNSILLPNAGFVAFRNDWTENAVSGFFDGGKFGRCHNHEDVIRCHQHEDKLNFLMYCNGKNILAEGQSYAYDTSKMRYHILSSAAHNVALVNGEGQNRLANNHWDESMLTSVEDITFKEIRGIQLAKAKYDEGYGNGASLRASHIRTVYFVKSPELGQPYFIVKDRLSALRNVNFDIVWHYNTAHLDVSEGKAICQEVTTFFAGNQGNIRVFCGSEEPFAGWISNSFTQGDFSPIPTVYYGVSGKTCEVVSAFVPNTDGNCMINSVDYIDGVISVAYKNGSKLVIDF